MNSKMVKLAGLFMVALAKMSGWRGVAKGIKPGKIRWGWALATLGSLCILVGVGLTLLPSGRLLASVGNENDIPNLNTASFPTDTSGSTNAGCYYCHGGDPGGSRPSSTAGGNLSSALQPSGVPGLPWHGKAATAPFFDSDGDGFTNGEELQDPTGSGANNDPFGDTAYVSNPSSQVDYTVAGQLVRGYPPPPQVTDFAGLNNGQTFSGAAVISVPIRYAGLSQVVFRFIEANGTEVFSHTAISPANTNYDTAFCLGSTPVPGVSTCPGWNSSIVPNGVYTVTATAYDKRSAALGGPQTGSLLRTMIQVSNKITATNLSVSKVDSSDPALIGAPLTYTLTVLNLGPDPATGVVVNDFLPPAVDFVSLTTSAGPICTEFGGTVNCFLDDLAVDEPVSVTVVVTPTASGTVTNVVYIGGLEFDPDLSNNAFTETTFITTPDLAISKQVSAQAAALNEPLLYTIAITNNGPGTATSLSLEDTLPPGVTFNTVTPGAPTCTEAAGLVTCNLGDLAAGATTGVTLSVTPTVRGIITNTATVQATPADLKPSDNTATVTSVVGLPDLTISKDDLIDPVLVGQDLTYTLTITNLGPETATGVLVTDTLPAGFSVTSVTPGAPTCTLSGNTLTCNLGTLTPEAAEAVTVIGSPNQGGVLHNTATVAANEPDFNPANNTITETTIVDTIAYRPYLYSISKDDNKLRVVNPADGSTVSSVEMTFPGETVNQGHGLATHPTTGALWALLKLQGQPGRELAIINPATGVATPIGDTGADDRRFSSLAFDATGSTLYAITGDGSPTEPKTLFTLSMTDAVATKVMRLDNGGAGEAISFNPDDNLLYHISGYGSQNDLTSGEIFEAINPNTKMVTPITLSGADYFGSNALLYEGGDIFLLADCGRGGADACTKPFTSGLYRLTTDGLVVSVAQLDHVSKGLAGGADLLVSQRDSADPSMIGEPLTYTITLINAGFLTAGNVVLTDTLPASVNFSSISPGGPSCTESGGVISCDFGNLPQDATRLVTLVVTPTLTTTIVNTVTVSSTKPDPNPANNSAVEMTLVWDGVRRVYLPVVIKE
jgi:uncharacterized repeat protein (TIGR01451 family)